MRGKANCVPGGVDGCAGRDRLLLVLRSVVPAPAGARGRLWWRAGVRALLLGAGQLLRRARKLSGPALCGGERAGVRAVRPANRDSPGKR